MYSQNKITRTISLIGVSVVAINVFVALAIPVQLSAQTPLSAPTITTFDVPGAADTTAQSINPTGVITGQYDDGSVYSVYHGFVRDNNGNITTFDPTGSVSTLPFSINPTGVITGYYYDGSVYHVSHGFVRDNNGNITTFDPTGSDSTYAVSINPTGVITGYYDEAAA